MAIESGSQVYGQDLPPSQFDQEWTTQNPTTTTYVPGTPECGVNFTAPASGRVLVTVGCGAKNNAATNDRAVVTFQVFHDNADGPIVVGASFNSGVTTCGVAAVQQYRYVGTFKMVSNLTPGHNYYARTVHRNTAGGAQVFIASRDIAVIPLT